MTKNVQTLPKSSWRQNGPHRCFSWSRGGAAPLQSFTASPWQSLLPPAALCYLHAKTHACAYMHTCACVYAYTHLPSTAPTLAYKPVREWRLSYPPSPTVHLLNPEPGCHQGCLLSESLQASRPIEVSRSSGRGMVPEHVGTACLVFFFAFETSGKSCVERIIRKQLLKGPLWPHLPDTGQVSCLHS